jgi:hypothetical protein
MTFNLEICFDMLSVLNGILVKDIKLFEKIQRLNSELLIIDNSW